MGGSWRFWTLGWVWNAVPVQRDSNSAGIQFGHDSWDCISVGPKPNSYYIPPSVLPNFKHGTVVFAG